MSWDVFNWDRDADFQKVQVQATFWIASAGPHHILFTPKRTFPYRTSLCSHSWSRYQRVVCMNLASFRGWKKIQTKPGAEAGNGTSQQGVHPFALAEHGLGELPSILFFTPGSFLWHCLRSLNHKFQRFPLTPWVSLMQKILLQPTDPICHLQWSHQHQLQERNNNLGAQLPQPPLSPWGWEGGNCSTAFSGCQRVTRS